MNTVLRPGLRIVLRTGFPHDDATARDLLQAFPGAALSTWPMTRAWADWHGSRFAAFDEDWVLFVDGCYPQFPAQTMQGGLRRMGTARGLTLHTPGLDDLWPGGAQGGGVAQRQRAVAGLPPWWALVERKAFAASEPGAWQSLEFALANFGRHLSAQGTPALALGDRLLPFDLVPWIDAVFGAAARHWEQDWRRWQAEGYRHLPYQYEVATFGIGHDRFDREIQGVPPTFSLLCPAYKSAFIDELLDSVCGQTYPHWELLVRVDGPPEPDRSILEERLGNRSYERRIRWRVQENLGTAKTRRALSEAARNDYLFFIDDDDCLEADALEVFAQALDCHGAAGAVRGGATLFGLVDRYLPPSVRHTVHGMSADLFEVNQPFAVRRDLLDRLGGLQGDPEFGGVGEDTDLFLRLEGAGVPVVLVDKPLYRRRISPLNQSLLFDGRGFTGHVRTLAARHLPPSWHVSGITFREEGAFVRQVLAYRDEGSGQGVHCPTRYFNFHTLGGDRADWTVLELMGRRDGASREMDLATVGALLRGHRESGQPGRYLLAGIPSVLDASELEAAISLLAGDGAQVGVILGVHEASHGTVDALTDRGVATFFVYGAGTEDSMKALARDFPGATFLDGDTLPWRPDTAGWTVQPACGSGSGPWHEAGVCAVAAGWDFYLAEGLMVACPAAGAAGEWHAGLQEATQQEGRLLKLGRYRRGRFAAFCRGCPHCPGAGACAPGTAT